MTATTVFRNALVCTGLLLIVTGCFDEDSFVDDNAERTGRNFPVITDLSVVSGEEVFQEGETVRLDVRFFSEDPVASVNLLDSLVVDGSGVRAQEQVKSVDASEAAFSAATQTDSLVIEYDVPSNLPADTTFIDLDVEVVNENGLTKTNETAENFAISGFGITGLK